ncbi:MAG: hypothetical protein GY759_04450 [Chloroflexi bacterium]|nr:hypothetical protein [Chloroflexota bacterium]
MSLKSPVARYRCLDGKRRPLRLSPLPESEFDSHVAGVLSSGHGHASGRNPESPYIGGTLNLQYPIFKRLGLDLGECYPGTLNISITPFTYQIIEPEHEFLDIAWFPGRQAENFCFCRCLVFASGRPLGGYLYHPDPATKVTHPDNPSHLQIVSPYIPSLVIGSPVDVGFRSQDVIVSMR